MFITPAVVDKPLKASIMLHALEMPITTKQVKKRENNIKTKDIVYTLVSHMMNQRHTIAIHRQHTTLQITLQIT